MSFFSQRDNNDLQLFFFYTVLMSYALGTASQALSHIIAMNCLGPGDTGPLPPLAYSIR